jgi:hypothetical protein
MYLDNDIKNAIEKFKGSRENKREDIITAIKHCVDEQMRQKLHDYKLSCDSGFNVTAQSMNFTEIYKQLCKDYGLLVYWINKTETNSYSMTEYDMGVCSKYYDTITK